MSAQPKKLRSDPIVEAIFEIRFETINEGVSDLLPGMLFANQKSASPKVERLAGAFFPKELQSFDPNLRYQAKYRIITGQYILLLGDHSIALSSVRPYVGWEVFKPKIMELLSDLKSLQVISSISRFALKYINALEASGLDSQYSLVNLRAQFGKLELTKSTLALKTELQEQNFVTIVEFGTNAMLTAFNNKSYSGAVLTLDTVSRKTDGFWDDPSPALEEAHETEKSVFFSLLTDSALKQFGAEY